MQITTPAEQLLFSTVLIQTKGQDPSDKGAGTAFIFAYSNEEGVIVSLVTNKHVINGARRGTFFFTKRAGDQPAIGERYDVEIDNFEDAWHGHSDPEVDIAVMPLSPLLDRIRNESGVEVFIRSLSHEMIPSQEQLEELDALEEVIFVGYPSAIYDTVNLMPVFRRGTTATPLQVDYDGRPIFLIDASVFPGSSGSPVVIYNLGGYSGKHGFTVGTRLFLLGIILQVMFQEEEGTIDFAAIPTSIEPVVRTRQMIDIGVVYKARLIVEAVEQGLSLRQL